MTYDRRLKNTEERCEALRNAAYLGVRYIRDGKPMFAKLVLRGSLRDDNEIRSLSTTLERRNEVLRNDMEKIIVSLETFGDWEKEDICTLLKEALSSWDDA